MNGLHLIDRLGKLFAYLSKIVYYPVLNEIKIFKTVAFVKLTLLKLYLICELPCSVCRCRRFLFGSEPNFLNT
jgi:hypothetical protein